MSQASPTIATSPPQLNQPTSLRFGIAIALLIGVLLWWFFGRREPAPQYTFIVMGIAIAVGLLPPVSGAFARVAEKLRRPSPRASWLAALVIAILSGVFLYAIAIDQQTDLILKFQDEHAYMLQMRMLAQGRLWMDPLPPPLADSLDTFFVLTSPKYSPIYFPGAALLYVPTIWLNLPFWVMPLMVASMTVGLFYKLLTDLIDGVYAIAGVFVLLGVVRFRSLSLMLLSQLPMLFFAILLVLAWLRWRRDRRLGWAMAIGVIAGWAAITRPLDALAYALPIGVAMLMDLRDAHAPAKKWLATLALLGAAAAPFLAIQVIQNVATTGHVMKFASDSYVEQTYPGPMLGFHDIDWSRVPVAKTPDIQRANAEIVHPHFKQHAIAKLGEDWSKTRLPYLMEWTWPKHLFFMALVPVGVLGLTNRPRRVVGATGALFVALYAFYAFFLPHYLIVLAPIGIFLILAGIESIARAWPANREPITCALLLAAVALPVSLLPEFTGKRTEYRFPELVRVNRSLATIPPQERALVLFRTDPAKTSVFQEPMFNFESAWPDDARVVRAHDLDAEKNRALFRYYANKQPDRVVYLYDRGTGALARLGVVTDLAK